MSMSDNVENGGGCGPEQQETENMTRRLACRCSLTSLWSGRKRYIVLEFEGRNRYNILQPRDKSCGKRCSKLHFYVNSNYGMVLVR